MEIKWVKKRCERGAIPLTVLLPAFLAVILYLLLVVQPGKGATPQGECEFYFRFRCKNGKCLPSRFQCNERDDCGDGSDELNCFSTKCGSDQFRCGSGKCIPREYRCDKKKNCLNGSDEQQCSCSGSEGMFQCRNDTYRCIQNVYRCDGYQDCADGSDEENCGARCSGNAFTCNQYNGPCIPGNGYCNKTVECPNGEDENLCQYSRNNNCTIFEFQCGSGNCIQHSKRCDGSRDCVDWSDETISCGMCTAMQFTCTTGECIPRSDLCNGFPDCTDKSDEINCRDGAPNHWVGKSRQDQIETLTRQFADGNVVVYYDTHISRDITWFHNDLSKAWQYVKEMYGPFGDDPRLYVIFNYLSDKSDERESTCEANLHNDRKYNGRNVIECFTDTPAVWTRYSFTMSQQLFSSIGDLIVKNPQEYNSVVFLKSNFTKYLSDLIFYDIFINILGNTSEIKDWNDFSQNETTGLIYAFHHDIFPAFYAHHGLAPVLSNFNILLFLYEPNFSSLPPTTPEEFALFMHFVNGAVGKNLLVEFSEEYRQRITNSQNNTIFNELKISALKFPFFTYEPEDSRNVVPPRNWHKRWRGQDEHLTLVYSNKTVAFYFKNFYIYTGFLDPFQKISAVWKFITENENYGLSFSKPFLHIVISDVQIQVPGDDDWGCLSSNDFVLDDRDFDSRHFIECGPSAHSKWRDSTAKGYLDDIMVHMARLILKLNGGVGNWPARDVSGWTMESILVLDIYRSLRTTFEVDHATDWQEKKTGNWFRGWYYPIYDKYGWSETIQNFLSLVNKNWPKKQRNHAKQMNTGEFVFFWSGSVNGSLLLLYTQDIGSNSGNNIGDEICHAIQDYSHVSYLTTWATTNSILQDVTFNPEFAAAPSTQVSRVEDSMNPLLIVIIPVACVSIVIIGILFAIACAVYHKKVRSLLEKTRELTDNEIDIFFKGNLNADETTPGYGFIESQPFNSEYEIPSNLLQIFAGKKLGSGAFGLVLSGTLKGSDEPGSRTAVDIPVAVKTVKPHVEVSIFLALLTEMKVMCFVGKHPHVVALHGAQTTKIRSRQVYIALEFCANGDLLNFLKKHRTDFKDLIGNGSLKNAGAHNPEAVPTTELPGMEMTTISISEQPPVSVDVADANQSTLISTLDLLKWAWQISSGMEFLGTKNVIHGDLAARNVLLTAEKTAKISDFGLSRQLYNYSTYVKKSKTPLPWNYMAIESLRDMEFSVQSDVWAFGVTLFEIFSLGTIPYAGRNWTIEFVDDLVAGLRLNAPKFGNDDVFNLMMDCMKLEPSERIKFPEMGHRLIEIQKKLELEMNPGSLSSYVIT